MNKPWLQTYPPEIPAEIDFGDKLLQQHFATTVARYPNKVAIHFLGKTVTFREWYESSLKMARFFAEIGIERGDRVAIMLPNCPQSAIAYFAILMVGGVVVQTNPLYTERELQYQMNDSGAKAIVALDLLNERIGKVKAHTKLRHVIMTSIKDYLPFPKNLFYPLVRKKQYPNFKPVEPSDTVHLWKTVMARPKLTVTDEGTQHDLALLQYTGGTTGFPKGVMLTHRNLVTNTLMCKKWMYKLNEGEEIILGILPFFHVYGMTTVLLLSAFEGYKMVLLPKFDVDDALKAIAATKPTLFPGAPTIYIGLLNHPQLSQYDLSSIKACISGSAPLPVDVQEKFERVTGGKLVEGYGLSEASPVTHANYIWGERVRGSIGVPWPNTEAMVLSFATNEQAAPGEIGELIVRGPQVMKGYWNNPEETDAVLREGWLYTGDLGYMDERGFYFIVDRKKDMIIASGYNVYPREVEEVLYEHEAIQECVVAGVPDPYRGENVKAYIVLKQGKTLTEEELNHYLREHLASYKVPRIYEFRTELPKTAVGKILRRVLVDEEKAKLNQQ